MVFRELPKTDSIDLNNFDKEAKEMDITVDENYEEIYVNDPVQLVFHTVKELLSHRNRRSSKETLGKLSEDFIQRYESLDKHQKNVVLIKIASSHYINVVDLKDKVTSIQGPESMMKSENEIRKILEPSYQWIFERLSKVPECGPTTLDELQKHLSNVYENIPYLSSHQKTAICIMKNHLTEFIIKLNMQEKEKPEIPPCAE